MPEIKQLVVQIRRPTGGADLGQVEYGHYILGEGIVTLADEHGTPLKRGSKLTTRSVRGEVPVWSTPVPAGQDPYRCAARLLYSKYSSEKSGTDFNRPIHYPPLNIV